MRARRALPRALAGTALASALALAAPARPHAATDVVLPTEWRLETASGPTATTGTLPEGATLTADGAHLVVLEGGQAGAALRVLDPATLATQRVVTLDGAFGAPLADASGSGVWAGTGGTDSLIHLNAAAGLIDRKLVLGHGVWPSAIARSPDGKTLAVTEDLANALALVDVASGAISMTVAVGSHPAGVAFSKDGGTVFVANWGASSVSAVDPASKRVTTIDVGLHPEAVALSPDGSRLFVSETDDDAIGVIDVATKKHVGDVNVGLFGGTLFGASPTALALAPDGKRLYATCSAANAIVAFALDGATPRPLGALAVGWYPTAVAVDASGALDVVDGKGEGQRANPEFDPLAPRARQHGYVAANTFGSVRRIARPDEASLAAGVAMVRAQGGPFLATAIRDDAARMHGPDSDSAGRAVVRPGGPIHHVILIVKENRTYDQVLGDLAGADGDPALALFGAAITPNQHALATRFGTFDAAYADAQVSADGHNWTMGAFANDYLEKMWPANYGSRRHAYDFEDGATASVPHGNFLWNAAARAGLAFRNYGEFTSAPAKDGGDWTTRMADLASHTDPRFPGFDVTLRDEAREAEWKREFDAYVASANLPALEIVRLPNDHTAGTSPGARTPQAMVAENDLAFARLVDAVSHSRYWKDTAIFSVEDDAQNGPDHVSAQRMPIYVVSPYAKAGVHHERYSTAGVVRTIELLVGLAPLSAYDAAALPLYAAFTPTPDVRPFDALPEKTDLDARNGASAYRARDSARLDFSRADAVPDGTLNDIVWHAVRGANAALPPEAVR